ncbi:uncharacterized protein LOC135155721 [Lytechinus pictus]|uniref:uncharacterized protein LOC135155721 n=1 Tax=Lytechinus pictus TaxID=7653 RepID=UPI0030B9F201
MTIQGHSGRTVQNIDSSQSRLPRLGLFSGKEPVKQGEVDWETFYDVAKEIAAMPSLDEQSKRCEIVTRLVLPAKDFAKQVASTAPALDLLSFLDSIYGRVQNNNLLLQEFMGMVQDKQEKPSDFLKRLQLKASRLVEIGEFSPETAAQKLLDKFKLGCHDEYIITVTNLHNQIIAPPFPKLISIVREAEATRNAKIAQYKPNPKSAHSYVQQFENMNLFHTGNPKEAQSKHDKSQKNSSKQASANKPKSNNSTTRSKSAPRCPVRVLVCFKCGDFDHKETDCPNPPNEERKNRNLARRKEIIAAWDSMNSHNDSPNE